MIVSRNIIVIQWIFYVQCVHHFFVFFMLFVDFFKVANQSWSEIALVTLSRVNAICTSILLSSVSTCTLLTSTLAGMCFGGSNDVGLHSSCSCLMVVDCCLVFDLRWLLGGSSTSVGAAWVTVVSVGSSSCFTGLMGWFWSLCMVVQLRSGMYPLGTHFFVNLPSLHSSM